VLVGLLEVSFGSDSTALIGALLLFSGLGLIPFSRLLAERSFPAPRVLFVRWGFTHLLSTALIFVLTAALAASLFGGEGIVRALLVGFSAFVIAALFIARVAKKTEPEPAHSMGLCGASHGRGALLGVSLYLLFLPALFGVSLLSPWLLERTLGEAEGQEVLLMIGALEGGALIFALVLAGLLQPILEEVLFRGFLQPLLVQNFRESGGIFLTSLAFAALHGAVAFLPVFCLSLLLGAIYLRTRSLVAVALVHATHNSLILALFLNFPEWRELSGASVFWAC
jgi:membrane protease YdiL (CAAX protease family)